MASDPDRSRKLGREQAQLAPDRGQHPALRETRAQLPRRAETREGDRPGAPGPRARGHRRARGRRDAAHRGAPRPAAAQRPQRRPQRHPRDPRRHRRRGGRPVRLRAAPDVRPLRRAPPLGRGAVEPHRDRHRGRQGGHPRDHGRGAYSRLKFEGGVHRVQRVPATESSGRLHTSTATVAVLPEADEVDVRIDEDKDLRIEVKRSSGPGGQSRQHHRLRGAHHPPAHGPRGRDPGREDPAQEQGQGDGRAAVAAAGAGAAQGPRAGGRGAPRAWWAPASAPRRSGPTISARTG